MGVAGVNLPAFVERASGKMAGVVSSSVAGVNLPAFVERASAIGDRGGDSPVSPGLISRPSLSAAIDRGKPQIASGVAGVNLPAFVERANPCGSWWG